MISEQGTIELGELGLASYFDHPKPVGLIKKALQIATEDGDLILDFFAGSGTTGQAVMELNKEESTNRHFVLVQLPEKTGKSEFKTLADVTAERLRRVIKKMDVAHKAKPRLIENPQDLGFRAYKLDRSSFKAWQEYGGENLEQLETLFSAFETPLIDGWNSEGLLSELLLIEGFPLNAKALPAPDFTSNKVLQVESDFSEHRLFICLEPEVKNGTIERLALLPKRDIFICLDGALDDAAKVRLNDVGNVRTI
jgi:adenine-specific DNA-methyltransferase